MTKLEKDFKKIDLQSGRVFIRKNVGSGIKSGRVYVYYSPRGSLTQKYLGNTEKTSFSILKDRIIEEDRDQLRKSLDVLHLPLGNLLDRFGEHIGERYTKGTYRLKTMKTYHRQVRRLKKIFGKKGSLKKSLKGVEGTGTQVDRRFREGYMEPVLNYSLNRQKYFDKNGNVVDHDDDWDKREPNPESYNTIKSTFSVFGVFFDWCYDKGYLKTNPYKVFGRDWLYMRLSEEHGSLRFSDTFTTSNPKEIEGYDTFKCIKQFYVDICNGENPRKFFIQDNDPDIQPSPVGHQIIFLQTLTGCRIRELINLVWYGKMDQVSDDDIIRDTYSELSHDFSKIEIGGKTLRKRGRTRTVYVPEIYRPILEDRYRSWKETSLVEKGRSPFVFNTKRSRRGLPITEENVLTWFKREQEKWRDKWFVGPDSIMGNTKTKPETFEDPNNPTRKELFRLYLWNLTKGFDGTDFTPKREGFSWRRRITSHDIRSFYITNLLEDSDIPLDMVSRYVGHSSTKTTEKFYISNPNLTHEDITRKMEEFTTDRFTKEKSEKEKSVG